MKKQTNGFLLLCILCTAICLRPPIISVTPLVEIIRGDLALSASTAGLITTIPLMAFACLSATAGQVARKLGLGRTLQLALMSIGCGILLRSFGIAGLLGGTVLVGVGIAYGNVLLPAVVKARFPQRVGLITATYSTVMNGMAGLASALSVPLAVRLGLGWRNALLLWCIPTVVGVVLWGFHGNMRLSTGTQERGAKIWRSPTAWWVALYMGFQSLFFYSFMAWAPSVLTAKGFDRELAGYLVTVYQLTGIPGNLLMPLLAARLKNPRWMALGIGLAYTLGLAGFWAADSVPLLVVTLVVMGVGTGACFSYCMTLMSLRAGNARIAAQLSGMSQSVGYTIAAVGPVLLGRLVDATGSWNTSLLCMLLTGIALTILGQKVCSPKVIE